MSDVHVRHTLSKTILQERSASTGPQKCTEAYPFQVYKDVIHTRECDWTMSSRLQPADTHRLQSCAGKQDDENIEMTIS
jgi:hypothetical protein